MVVLGIDANARLPCGFDEVTGSIEHGEPDAFGYRLAELFSELGLWAPATFGELHSGATATCRHAQGHTSRIDFICLNREIPCSDIQSWVAHDLDLLTTSDDHYAVALSGGFWKGTPNRPSGHLWRRQYDLSKLSSAEGKEVLRDDLAAVEPVPWTVEVNAHAAILEQISHEVLDRYFAVKRDGPRSSYISVGRLPCSRLALRGLLVVPVTWIGAKLTFCTTSLLRLSDSALVASRLVSVRINNISCRIL